MNKFWTNEDMQNIFQEIEQFKNELKDIENKFKENGDKDIKNEEYKEKVWIFIGDAPYPQNRSTNPTNIPHFGIYSIYKFSEVAFLCNKRTLELYSIIGVLFNSLDAASQLIDFLLSKNYMDIFAKYLWYKKRVLLVNANNQKLQIEDLLKNFNNYNVFLCCGQKYKLSDFPTLNKSKTKQFRHFNFMIVNHPSPRSYQTGFDNTCKCYMDRTFVDNKSNLSFKDFVLF